jgi:hypothetical protein
MKFRNLCISKPHRFAIGIEDVSGKHYISIPVSNQLVDYEEYYEISDTEFKLFEKSLDEARALADRCKKRLEDVRLLQKPGKMRGSPT